MNILSTGLTHTVWLRSTLPQCDMDAIFPLPLRGTDLIFGEVPLMLILSGPLDQERLTVALVKTLDYYPHIISRVQNDHGDVSLIEGKAGIPLTFAETNEAYDHYTPQGEVPAHLFDSVNLNANSSDEPLCRLRITFCHSTNETYIGLSFGHMLGDGTCVHQFLSAWSQYYQGLEPIFGRPTWDKYKTAPPDADLGDPDTMAFIDRHLPNFKRSYPIPEFMGIVEELKASSERIDIVFTADQIKNIHQVANTWPGKSSFSGNLSKQDSLSAYVITVYNQCLNVPITRVFNTLNYRSIRSPEDTKDLGWRSPGPLAIGNAVTQASTPSLTCEDAKSLGAVAWNIRKSINDARGYDHLKQMVSVGNSICNQRIKEQRMHKFWREGEVLLNCTGKTSFPGCHFGFGRERTRFVVHEPLIGYIRFRMASPVKLADGSWQSNEGSLQLLLRVPKDIREKFLAIVSAELNSPAFPQNLIHREKQLFMNVKS